MMKVKTKGETIVEILIAMTILVLIITSTYVILLRAMKTNTSIKNRVRALNIAREGIEGVRNIRDTNWLRYSGNRRNNWLCRPGISTNPGADNPYVFASPIALQNIYSQSIIDNLTLPTSYIRNCIEAPNPIQDGFYILEYFSPPAPVAGFAPRYILEPQMAPLGDPDTDREKFRLHWVNNRSTHASRYYDGAGYINTDPSIFYRVITLETAPVFEDPVNGTCLANSVDIPCNLQKLKVTSVVQWDEEGDNVFESVTLETHLYDYFERTNY